ncbi:MAG: hypothetical protein VB087_04575 [Candidatus Limiplasma sp.]|nr:hypothetical protein [Candidatus Limiplasma sp.]
MATDWLMLKDEYLQTSMSLRAVAAKAGVPYAALSRRAARLGWAKAKRAGAGGAVRGHPAKAPQAALPAAALQPPEARGAADAPPAQAAGAVGTPLTRQGAEPAPEPPMLDTSAPGGEDACRARLVAIRDQLTEQLARATGELDKQVLLRRCKTRAIEYGGEDARGKPVEEVTREETELTIVDATVDSAGLQRLSATLKTLTGVVQAGDVKSLGVEMVAALMRRLDAEAAGLTETETMPDGALDLDDGLYGLADAQPDGEEDGDAFPEP